MPEQPNPPPWRPGQILPWVQIVVMVGGFVWWSAQNDATTRQLIERMSEMRATVSSIRAEMMGAIAEVRSGTANLPRMSAEMANFERRLSSLEKAGENQDDRIGRLGDALGTVRLDLNELRAEQRAITNSSRIPLPQPGRVPR